MSDTMPGLSYNQGLYLSAAAHMYTLHGDPGYLRNTASLIEAVMANHTTKNGLLREPPPLPLPNPGSDFQCSQGYDPGSDWYNFKGILVLNQATTT